MKSKKNLIILSVVVSIIIIGIVLGVLYFTTDLFKTEQQLFYKYISKINIIDSNFIAKYNMVNTKLFKNSNSSNTNMEVMSLVPNQETGVSNIQKILNISSNGLKDSVLNQSYRDFVFSNNNQNFLTIKYLKDGNTYGLLADNIVTKYLAVENSNLKELFSKLGIEDTRKIPNSIPTNYDEMFKIDESILEQLKQTYGTLIYNNINKENFYKIKNSDNTEIIGVSLTEQELINLLKVILETVKNDNILLDLIVSKAQQLNYTDITVENLKLKIQNILDESANNSYSAEKDFIKISIVKKDKNIIKIQIENNQEVIENVTDNVIATETLESDVQSETIKNKTIIDIDFSELNKIILAIKENDNEIAKTTFDYSYDNDNINMNIKMQYIVENEKNITIKTQYQINNYQTDNFIQNLVVNMDSGTEENYQINLVNNVTLKQDVQISKLTTENSALLNSMTSEELSQLIVALINRITTLYNIPLNNFMVE